MTFMPFFPTRHYWLADDGRVYSGPTQYQVTTADQGYAGFLAGGGTPTRWPEDISGAQTDDALQDVLTPHGMSANLAYYTASARRDRMAGDITVNGLPFSTDPLTFGSLNSAYIYVQQKTTDVFSWKLPDGSFITLNKTDITALQDVANDFAQNCFLCEDTTLDGIEAGTITTHEQIDAAFAAISNTFTGLSSDAQKVRHGPKAAKK